jgi:hypothetical protein
VAGLRNNLRIATHILLPPNRISRNGFLRRRATES